MEMQQTQAGGRAQVNYSRLLHDMYISHISTLLNIHRLGIARKKRQVWLKSILMWLEMLFDWFNCFGVGVYVRVLRVLPSP